MTSSTKHHKISYSKEYGKSYIKIVAEIQHSGLNAYRVLKDKDDWILKNKINVQFQKWDEQWAKISHQQKIISERETNQFIAEETTKEAKDKIREIENILNHTLKINDAINWETLKNKQQYPITNPLREYDNEVKKISIPVEPTTKVIPPEPNQFYYQPRFSIIEKLIKSEKRKRIEEAERAFKKVVEDWKNEVELVGRINQRLLDEYAIALEDVEFKKRNLHKHYKELESEWEKEKQFYYQEQTEFNLKIDKLKSDYFSLDTNAVLEYCELVLNNSVYPDCFTIDFDLEYSHTNKLLVIEYVLPAPEYFPTVSEVKYIASKNELKETHLTEAQQSKLFDNTIYCICLRTIHEIFEADTANAIDMITFNGWVDVVNKATGKNVNNCIISIQVKKSDFSEIDLAHIDPKACFKNLKGVGSSKLISLTSIQPILQINKNDKRFVSSNDVAHTLHDGYNLAIMSWEDFEHLIRELFEKEFSVTGGEVKVTQASRDGGVDAIAFDPDPIRGGKIVIQAKRYSNTVGVSAVRDLYGTLVNEGANKGILVTTSDYGPDAYEFAKNKPITLLSGNNLLYLLEKHGHKARIDLQEAKQIYSESKKQ